jgi:hypothetical protein
MKPSWESFARIFQKTPSVRAFSRPRTKKSWRSVLSMRFYKKIQKCMDPGGRLSSFLTTLKKFQSAKRMDKTDRQDFFVR